MLMIRTSIVENIKSLDCDGEGGRLVAIHVRH